MDLKVRERVAQLGAAWPAQAAELVEALEAEAEGAPGPLAKVVALQFMDAAGAAYAGMRLLERQKEEDPYDEPAGGESALGKMKRAFSTLTAHFAALKLAVLEELATVPPPDELQEMIRGYEGQCADLRRQLAEAESQLAARVARWAQAEVILRRTKEVSWTHWAIVWMLRATGRTLRPTVWMLRATGRRAGRRRR